MTMLGIVRFAGKWVFYYIVVPLVRYIPVSIAYKLATILGVINYYLFKENRKIIRQNMKEVLKGKSDREIERLVKLNFINHAKANVEIILLPKIDEKLLAQRLDFHGFENIEEALKRGRGIIFSLGHMGIYYLAGAITNMKGCVMNDIAQDVAQLKAGRIEKKMLMKKLDTYKKVISGKIIHKDKQLDLLLEIIRILKKNEGISLFIDAKPNQNDPVIEFLGKKTYISSGTVAIAMRTGCAIIPNVTLRMPGNRWYIRAEKSVEITKTGNVEEDLKKALIKCTTFLEKYILEYPEQWHHWRVFHQRWVRDE